MTERFYVGATRIFPREVDTDACARVKARLAIAQQALEEIAELSYVRSDDPYSEHQEMADRALNAMRGVKRKKNDD